jgi:hypothetical protein
MGATTSNLWLSATPGAAAQRTMQCGSRMAGSSLASGMQAAFVRTLIEASR